MIEIEFTPEDVARTRFVVSPLWEVIVSVRVLKGADELGIHRVWSEQVRARVAAARVDLTPLTDLVPVPTRAIAGFLTPPPTTPLTSLDVELATLRATTPESLTTSSAIPPERMAALRADPDRELGRLAETIETYWELALAPYWPQILTLLQGDVSFRARRLVEGGARHLFNDLDPQVTWDAGTLHVQNRFTGGRRTLDGRGLLLMPSAFVWPRVFSSLDGGPQPTLRYPPRGIGTLWATPTRTAEYDALAGVLGRSRATLLAELTAPASTTDLARRTGLTPGGVSQHLSALRAAGLVGAHRAGRTVLYARTQAAETLLAAARSA
ncbi:ArsR family transcriptional regulator [Embleya sp. AB8]|uniref:ArsR/SmtB family transcription factor n=1 Tax=Embleya sp. AB8 TaxID=3156304 RepID=UPI003C723675